MVSANAIDSCLWKGPVSASSGVSLASCKQVCRQDSSFHKVGTKHSSAALKSVFQYNFSEFFHGCDGSHVCPGNDVIQSSTRRQTK